MSELMNDNQIKHMVDRFLGWKLPGDFNPDGGISFTKTTNEDRPSWPQKNEPTGTNLFDADQAEEMVRYMVAEVSPKPEAAPDSEAQAPAVQEWYWGSRCVECGKQIPAGQMQHCLHGGYCNHHVPVALRAEIAALRANHAGLKHAVEYTLRCLEETGWDQEIHSSVPGTLRGALAEARKLEGK